MFPLASQSPEKFFSSILPGGNMFEYQCSKSPVEKYCIRYRNFHLIHTIFSMKHLLPPFLTVPCVSHSKDLFLCRECAFFFWRGEGVSIYLNRVAEDIQKSNYLLNRLKHITLILAPCSPPTSNSTQCPQGKSSYFSSFPNLLNPSVHLLSSYQNSLAFCFLSHLIVFIDLCLCLYRFS